MYFFQSVDTACTAWSIQFCMDWFYFQKKLFRGSSCQSHYKSEIKVIKVTKAGKEAPYKPHNLPALPLGLAIILF